jgi:hypothetical protein
MNDKQKLNTAFRRMRSLGVTASLGINGCCRSCIWADLAREWEGKPVVWFYKGQGNTLRYDDNGMLTSHHTIYLNHNSEQFPEMISKCVDILNDVGLKAEWNGEQSKCICVFW